jgi:hypothetical protein
MAGCSEFFSGRVTFAQKFFYMACCQPSLFRDIVPTKQRGQGRGAEHFQRLGANEPETTISVPIGTGTRMHVVPTAAATATLLEVRLLRKDVLIMN